MSLQANSGCVDGLIDTRYPDMLPYVPVTSPQINEYEGKVFTDCRADEAPEVCQPFVDCPETGE
eukprot:11922971-Prorocentrum_lima.AAC.1